MFIQFLFGRGAKYCLNDNLVASQSARHYNPLTSTSPVGYIAKPHIYIAVHGKLHSVS